MTPTTNTDDRHHETITTADTDPAPDEIRPQCESCADRTHLAEAKTKTVFSGPHGETEVLVFCPDCAQSEHPWSGHR